ncbi:MAG: acetate/propionate family kinase [Gammaproteobacteria bacterium]|jgi:acetate kinase
MKNAILVINAGSSSIKFAVFSEEMETKKLYRGIVDHVSTAPDIVIYDTSKKVVLSRVLSSNDYEQIVTELITSINLCLKDFTIIAVGHRVVHGGVHYLQPILINDVVIDDLTKLIPLAPLHQPYNLKIIVALKKLYPNLSQVACFDTAFHATQEKLAKMFAIPRKLTQSGVIRYGFHGLSYEYIASILSKHVPNNISSGKVIVAHLGNGSSLCAMRQCKSKATSMGFTALEGLMMGTRTGHLDPGVVLYLLEELKLTVKQTVHLLYSESGLLGVSGISGDVRELTESQEPNAEEAIELFCYRAAQEIAALIIPLNGMDALVFTAGIGEHSYIVRKKICQWFEWMGLSLNEQANKNDAAIISDKDSKIVVAVIPTNEELMIVNHTMRLI